MSSTTLLDAPAITVWNWHDAPDDLRALSEHNGGESWVALVPASYARDYHLGFLDRIDGSTAPQVENHPTLPGYEVWIGAHKP